MIMSFGSALWHLIAQSDFVCKSVLLILLVMSIICWTVFFYKLIILRTKFKQLRDAREGLRNVHSLQDIVHYVNGIRGTIAGALLARHTHSLQLLLDRGLTGKLSIDQWHLLEQDMAHNVDEILYHEESYTSVLSVSAAVSPLLGLFGTVWGLVHSFVSISEKQTADIATVAPGIAEALITTLAGLVVAIPALMMFTYIQVKIRHLEQAAIALSDQYALSIRALLLG